MNIRYDQKKEMSRDRRDFKPDLKLQVARMIAEPQDASKCPQYLWRAKKRKPLRFSFLFGQQGGASRRFFPFGQILNHGPKDGIKV
jgi:hypothetical protein